MRRKQNNYRIRKNAPRASRRAAGGGDNGLPLTWLERVYVRAVDRAAGSSSDSYSLMRGSPDHQQFETNPYGRSPDGVSTRWWLEDGGRAPKRVEGGPPGPSSPVPGTPSTA